MATEGEGTGAAPEDASRVLGILDHSVLAPNATEADVLAGCRLGAALGVATVCVQPCWAKTAAEALRDSGVKPGSVLGFPHGVTTTEAKLIEAISLLEAGVRELDMVINVGWLKSGRTEDLHEDVGSVHAVCSAAEAVLKVILETCYLTEEEKRAGALLAAGHGVDFVKTSTGFGPAGATVEDVRLLREILPPRTGVKAAGGIRTLAQVREMMAAGAGRIGTSATAAIAAELGVEV